ncbi:hypothetical protein CQW23_21155 [Capsicum baccatum]|uniref:non-specific serine/threonine protein kinase n=1 Tax=Capsicum baccatum TaxID=33114 RepID=A0A2G2VX79_CAPBA|nr:hypothetical protein CQW23_21155 [Capsicum baccatum]
MNLMGVIPREIGNLTFLVSLDLGSNNFHGNLPQEMAQLRRLKFLDLSVNNFGGEVPSWFGFLHQLQVLNLRNNSFTGSIPSSFSNISTLGTLNLNFNSIEGNIPEGIGNLHNMNWLSIQYNQLTGSIPFTIFNISRIEIVSFTGNSLSGSLPNGLCYGLPILKGLYLSYNKLHGRMPTSLSNCSQLQVLSLSKNEFDGPIHGEIGRLSKSAPQQANSLSTEASERISYYELLRATNALSESNLIGSGGFSSVYKGVLRSGTVIAVKVFNLQLDVAFKSFDTECEVLRSLRHRNIVKVITSCSNLDFKALVLDYMPNGNLEKYLYSHNYFLDIKQRLSIMIDVACALEYLHHGCSLPVIHCDVKPSNVLLDEDMVAHLSDFGISKLLGEDQGDLYTKTLATLGYIAPEYGLDGLVSAKCDVYSYGVMLLETFTRRKPNEFEGDLSLKQWVSFSLPDAVMDVVDANLVTQMGSPLQMKLDVVASIMIVALDCCAENPARRTNMNDVVGMLQKINVQLLAC